MTDATLSFSAGNVETTSGLLRRVMAGLRRAYMNARARTELMLLDDRLLADIGLRRSDIGAAIEGKRGR